jgi:hypothetical protein
MSPAAALALAAVLPLAPHPDSTSADSAHVRPHGPPVVRTFSPLLVHATAFDPRSTQTIQRIEFSPADLPADRVQEMLRARPGVVLQGEELHVRGGRAGEVASELDDLPFNDPLRGSPLEVPRLALDGPSLLTGGLEAEHQGALAGVLALATTPPPTRPQGRLAWQTDGATFTRYDRVEARLGAPLGVAGYGLVADVDATLDDTSLPALRSESRHALLGIGGFGWRADNHLLAHVLLAPTRAAPGGIEDVEGREGPLRLEGIVGRTVTQPYDRMFTLDGWVKELADSVGSVAGPEFFPTEVQGSVRYRAADHVALTDTRQVAWLGSWNRYVAPRATVKASAGLVRVDRLTSVGGRTDQGYVTRANAAEFGLADWPTSDPFDVYAGDEPIFRRSRADRLMARGEWMRTTTKGGTVRAGVEGRYDHVRLFELDGTAFGQFLDSLRTYDAYAPGGAAWVQSRIVTEGMVANLGARLGWFSAGPEARAQSLAAGEAIRDHVTLAPRLGIAFPVGVRDATSFSYTRIDEDPARDFLYDNRNHVSNRQPVGNPGLEPATVVSYEIVEKHAFDERTFLQTGFYYRDLYGLVGTVWEDQGGFVERPTYENAGQGHASGVELSLAREFPHAIHARFAYTFGQAEGPTSLEEGVRFGIPLGARPPAIANAPLDWDLRHVFGLEVVRVGAGPFAFGWTTVVASGAPWTPHDPRAIDADLSRLNSRRLAWSEETDARITWTPPGREHAFTVGLEARNLFDHRGDLATTTDGFPNKIINTQFDDYGAYRTETGNGGGGYFNDVDGDGVKDWVPVGDPTLAQPPRALRLSLGWAF